MPGKPRGKISPAPARDPEERARELAARLRGMANPRNAAGMARFGITAKALGIGMGPLREMARELSRDHALALCLWETGLHEARILAALTDEPAKVTEEQMEAWVCAVDSWDLCDQVMNKLFDRTPFAYDKALFWSDRPETFVKRGGFSLMATLAVHDKKAPDGPFLKFLAAVSRQADDPRNFVKKAVNWALRQVGKRNRRLHASALALAEELCLRESAAARWVGRDARRELLSEKVIARLPANPGTKVL